MCEAISKIAIFGATSEISKDLICLFSKNENFHLTLIARRPQAVREWLSKVGLSGRFIVQHFDEFSSNQYFDALINFVGVGNPAQAAVMGASILDVTYRYDTIVLQYLQQHPKCRYIFLSSGAAYGSNFSEPVNQNSEAKIPINNCEAKDWYGVAKLHAEARHRAQEDMAIVDIRVFNYFSHTQDMDARFFISDMTKAIHQNLTFNTSKENFFRDYLHPEDFYQIVLKILSGPMANCAIDCYSKKPLDKFELLGVISKKFGLEYCFVDGEFGVNATGKKNCYYSLNKKAAEFGYIPKYNSLEGICKEMELYLQLCKL